MQKSVIAECELRAHQDPRWRYILAIPNGGHRDIRVAAKLKAEGVRRGIPDLFLAVASRGYHGLWIELKVGKNRESVEQMDWKVNLTDNGYCCMTVRDYPDRVVELILWYLGEEE